MALCAGVGHLRGLNKFVSGGHFGRRELVLVTGPAHMRWSPEEEALAAETVNNTGSEQMALGAEQGKPLVFRAPGSTTRVS